MARRKIGRMVQLPPAIKGMSVSGVRGKKSNEVFLHLEEYEVIRLLDYKGLTQEQAAVFMQISRPTLTRIYEEARIKVATSFAEGRELVIKGGNFYFDDSWYKCNGCQATFNDESGTAANCPICQSTDIVKLNDFYKV